MLKILFVIENIYFGGGERAFTQIINSLDKSRYQIYVACAPGGFFEKKISSAVAIVPVSLRNCFSKISN